MQFFFQKKEKKFFSKKFSQKIKRKNYSGEKGNFSFTDG